MKNSVIISLILFIVSIGYSVYAKENTKKINFYEIGNSYILRSSNQRNWDYIWLKITGDEQMGNAVSSDCDILFSGEKKGNLIFGKTLYYKTDISENLEEKKFNALLKSDSIFFEGDKIFDSCGLNVIYGEFKKKELTSEEYKERINEILIDSHYDSKSNNKPNGDAYYSLISNLECNYVVDNIDLINDIGFYLQEKKYYIQAGNILKRVLMCKPERMVAYLNIADIYIAKGQKDLAIKNYEKYVELMKSKSLERKIPPRVLKLTGKN
ncbi:tetratricopeptide repeat protein [Acinetobacter courvalinii]|uniref:tetratricopeptide repeat protein n=1 Tax=Acinetobacter courvalinii TaxID=280147 RepID=UPI00289FBF39|nr:tetratricopeptide repeat protein [Acinetobacter courvalinii]